MKILLLISFNFLQHIRQCFFPIVAFVHAVRAKGCLLYNIFLAKKNIQFELKKIENNLLLTLFQETPLSEILNNSTILSHDQKRHPIFFKFLSHPQSSQKTIKMLRA